LAPVTWSADGWPIIAGGGLVPLALDVPREPAPVDALPAPAAGLGPEWNFLRSPNPACWSFDAPSQRLRLWGQAAGLDEAGAPAWVGRRQEQFEQGLQVEVDFAPESHNEEAGLVVWMNERHHAEIFITQRQGQRVLVARRRIGSLAAEVALTPAPQGALRLGIEAEKEEYRLTWSAPGEEAQVLARAETRYLSTEVAGGFTGVYYALYASGNGQPCQSPAEFQL
jgi:alpha-N-arabinofuranosidase